MYISFIYHHSNHIVYISQDVYLKVFTMPLDDSTINPYEIEPDKSLFTKYIYISM